MIQPNPDSNTNTANVNVDQTVLVRYGAIPEVARFSAGVHDLERGQPVVVSTHRGLEIGCVLEAINPHVVYDGPKNEHPSSHVVRVASNEDLALQKQLQRDCEQEFDVWRGRIEKWNLNLELIELEQLLDRSKLVLYVLNDRGPDCTRLALQAAAAGLGPIEVQPVNSDGPISLDQGGGSCGSGGCGCQN